MYNLFQCNLCKYDHVQQRVIVVGRSVSLSARFLSNRGCGRYQTWMCGYVQRALGTARVWSVVVKEQRVYGGRLKFTLMCTFLVKAESGGYQTWICG